MTGLRSPESVFNPFWVEYKTLSGTDEMAEWVCVLHARPGNLSLIPGAHMVEGGTDLCKLSSDFHTGAVAYGHLLPRQ